MKKLLFNAVACATLACAVLTSFSLSACSSDDDAIEDLTPDGATLTFDFASVAPFNTVTLLDYSGSRLVQSMDFEVGNWNGKQSVVLNHGTHKIVAIANDYWQGDIYEWGVDTLHYWQMRYDPVQMSIASSVDLTAYTDAGYWGLEEDFTIEGNVSLKVFTLKVTGDVTEPITVQLEPITGLLDIEGTDNVAWEKIIYTLENVPQGSSTKHGRKDITGEVANYSSRNTQPFFMKRALVPEGGSNDIGFSFELIKPNAEGDGYWTNKPPKFSMKRGYVTRLDGPFVADNGDASEWTVKMIPYSEYYK